MYKSDNLYYIMLYCRKLWAFTAQQYVLLSLL